MSTKETILCLIGMLLVFSLLVSPVACTMHENMLLAKAVAEGVDPIVFKCATRENKLISPTCVVKALNK